MGIGHKKRIAAMVEQGFKPVIKKRQPMFHAGIARAAANRLVKRVSIHHRAKGGDIAAPKTLHRIAVQQNLSGAGQGQRLQLSGRALGFGIE